VILLIDFSYKWFHTTSDTLDKCSPESLGQVGRAVMEAIEAQ
jgi:Zn-dependent M28 family amino/carboxypeptidase